MSDSVEMTPMSGSVSVPVVPADSTGTIGPEKQTMWAKTKAQYQTLKDQSKEQYQTLKDQYQTLKDRSKAQFNSFTDRFGSEPEPEPVTEPGSGVKKETTFDKLGRKWNSNSTKQKWVLGIFFVLLFFAIIVALCYWASKICSGDASTQGVLCKLANDVTGAASDILLYPYIFIGILILGMLMKAFAFIRNNAKDKLTKKKTPEEKKEDKNERDKNPTWQEWVEGKTVDGVVDIPAALGTYIKKGIANLTAGKAFGDENNYDPKGDDPSGGDPSGGDPSDHPIDK